MPYLFVGHTRWFVMYTFLNHFYSVVRQISVSNLNNLLKQGWPLHIPERQKLLFFIRPSENRAAISVTPRQRTCVFDHVTCDWVDESTRVFIKLNLSTLVPNAEKKKKKERKTRDKRLRKEKLRGDCTRVPESVCKQTKRSAKVWSSFRGPRLGIVPSTNYGLGWWVNQ